jgi:hypothetical protein
MELDPKDRYELSVIVLHDGAKKSTLAKTRSICARCAAPAQTAELQTTLRRIPSILPGAY